MPQIQPHPPIQAKPRQEARHWAACAVPTSASKVIEPSKYKSSGAVVPGNLGELNSLSYTIHNTLQCRQCHLFLAVLPWQCVPLFPEPISFPIPRAWHCSASTFSNFFDIPASRQLQSFPFQFLLIFEALISEMYSIIGLYYLAIYLCLSLCSGLILFSHQVSNKRCCHCCYLAITTAHVALNY